MILGLSKRQVRLVPHQPGWDAAFARERELLRRTLGPAAREIEHVGSTAVPGLAAKPILDIAVGVRNLEIARGWPRLLRPHGYNYSGNRNGWGQDFYSKGPPFARVVHLHVVPFANPRWKAYLEFRDRLRADPGPRREYETIKFRLLQSHSRDRRAYTEGKAEMVRRVLAQVDTPSRPRVS